MMGRRKKSQSSPSFKGATSVGSIEESFNKNEEIEPKDLLELRLVRPTTVKGNQSVSSSPHEPVLFLNEQDAYQLDVVKDDAVFVLSRGQTNSKQTILAAALCSVRMGTSGSTPNKRGGSNIRVPPGDCRVAPSSLAEYLCNNPCSSLPCTSGATKQSSVAAVPSMPFTPVVVSPSKSSFSFARGGGGDSLISPSSKPSTPSSAVSSISTSSIQIGVVPFSCPLGGRISQRLCRDAALIQLEPLPTSSTIITETAWSTSKRILQRLILAAAVGRYIRAGDTIRSPFRGQSVDWQVVSVEGPSLENSPLHRQFATISLDEKEKQSEHEGVLKSLRSTDRLDRLCFYKIGYDTVIQLKPKDKEATVEGETAPVSVDVVKGTVQLTPKCVVAGLDATLEHVKSLLLPSLLRPQMFAKGSLRPPRGVLLHGPGGTGKSILAQQVAIDLEAMGIRVQTVNCTSLQSHTAIVGEAERRLTRLFHSAEQRSNAPSTSDGDDDKGTLIIMDDIHLICPKRGGSGGGGGGSSLGTDRLAATLLALLDGIGSFTGNPKTGEDPRRNVVILAITSNPSLLDPALRRPGRLDAEVEVPIPDEITRTAILIFQLDKVSGDGVTIPTLTDDDVLALSRLAKGFNGADCMLAVKEALRTAIVRSQQLQSMDVAQGGNSRMESANVHLTLRDLQSAIRATKPSTIKSITVEIPQVHWSSIGGMEDVKQKLREAIELPLTHAHLFQALHIPPPRGVLLYGPPGCSKTLMARALATEGHMNFLAVKGPELLSKWLGESERALASLFRRARMASPCIVFFDEIDAIAAKRGSSGGGGSGGERLLSQLLTELDGINSPGSSVPGKEGSNKEKRVIVVGATNRPDLLDSALMRPGRIDRMIYVGLPDVESRARILEIGLKGKACSDDIDIRSLASEEMTGGFSGAEMIAICREAALFAIEEDDENMSQDTGMNSMPRIGMRHLERAICGMQRQITPEMLDFYASFHNKRAT